MRYLTVTFYSADEAEKLSAEDLLVIVAGQELLAERIAEDGYEVPKTFMSSLNACKRELEHKLSADLEKELEQIESRRAALATVQEKRESLDQRASEIRAKLGRGVKATAATP